MAILLSGSVPIFGTNMTKTKFSYDVLVVTGLLNSYKKFIEIGPKICLVKGKTDMSIYGHWAYTANYIIYSIHYII